MIRKLVLLTSFFVGTPICIFILILGILYLSHQSSISKGYLNTKSAPIQFSALPDDIPATDVQLESTDARYTLLEDFLKRYDSPLLPHVKLMVELADKYNLDYRLIPAIAMQESTLCKKIPKDSHNCWGFGIYGGKVTRFANYQEAINTVSKSLANEYAEKGYEVPHEIVEKYAPSNDGSWADNVVYVMDRIEISL